MQDPSDNLSPVARQILKLDAIEAYSKLVVHGAGNQAAKAQLESIQPEQLTAGFVHDQAANRAMLAGLWLWQDWLDESHKISQGLDSATGSFWHAIMHRRKGDFSNSKYWYAKAGQHPMFAVIGAQAASILNPLPADKRLLRLNYNGWNANEFVDLVEAMQDKPADPLHRTVVALQQLEWRVLFDACARAAAGR